MTFFVVGYDIKTGNSDAELVEALAELDSVRTQQSVWYVSDPRTAKGLFDYLKTFVHEQDKLMVVEFTKSPRVKKGLPGTKDWLEDHFSSKS